jgi:hypothetical protein
MNGDVFRGLGVKVTLKNPDDFLKVMETLTRIGFASKKDKTLYQSCHILHKQGEYAIIHFKELFVLDGKYSDVTENDVARRNSIAKLLHEWGLVTIVPGQDVADVAPMSQIKVVAFKDKKDWTLSAKYTVGKK